MIMLILRSNNMELVPRSFEKILNFVQFFVQLHIGDPLIVMLISAADNEMLLLLYVTKKSESVKQKKVD